MNNLYVASLIRQTTYSLDKEALSLHKRGTTNPS
jgi:hypothetical protein